VEFCPYLQLYTKYARFHSEAVGILKPLLLDKKFKQFCDEALANPASKGLNLMAFLITPIQRV
jgi:hypothetical protein